MDMWDPYVTSTLNHLPEAQSKIVFDKFHIAKHLSEAADQVSRRENKQLRAQATIVWLALAMTGCVILPAWNRKTASNSPRFATVT